MDYCQIRKINCELGVLSRSDGSALFTMGDTICLASVYGPCEVKPQKLLIDKATIDIIYKPRRGLLSVADKLKESILYCVCQAALLTSHHPRSLVSINVQEMQDSGGLLACAINATCLALMNAGFPMKFLFAAVTGLIDEEDRFILDPDIVQMKGSKATFTFVFDGMEKNIVATQTSGIFTKEQFERVLHVCREASSYIFKFYRDIVKNYAHILVPL